MTFLTEIPSFPVKQQLGRLIDYEQTKAFDVKTLSAAFPVNLRVFTMDALAISYV